jgi:hypothetical protein
VALFSQVNQGVPANWQAYGDRTAVGPTLPAITDDYRAAARLPCARIGRDCGDGCDGSPGRKCEPSDRQVLRVDLRGAGAKPAWWLHITGSRGDLCLQSLWPRVPLNNRARSVNGRQGPTAEACVSVTLKTRCCPGVAHGLEPKIQQPRIKPPIRIRSSTTEASSPDRRTSLTLLRRGSSRYF